MFSYRIIWILIVSVGVTLLCPHARADNGGGTSFAWLSIAPEIGYVHFVEATVDKKLLAKIPARNGLTVKGHVDIGGDGIALELAPLYAWEKGGGLFGDFNVLGGEITLAFRFGTGSFYPGIGIGFHGAHIFANRYIKSGTQLYAPVPLGFTWYFVEYLGLVFEAGLMYGGTGVKAKKVTSGSSTDDDKRNALASDMKFGAGFAFDLLFGLRFP